MSGLAVLVIGVAVAVVLLKRHHSPAMVPGAYVGDSHATIFGPSQPTHSVTPATPNAPTSSVVTPTNGTAAADSGVTNPVDASVSDPTAGAADSVQPMPVAAPPVVQDESGVSPDKPASGNPGT